MKNPLVLVHGLDDTGRKFDTLAHYLKHEGWQSVYCPTLAPSNGDVPLEQLAQQLVVYVDTHLGADQPFDLLGFSMGGMIGRYYVQRLGGLRRIQRLVLVSAPHRGTWMGYGRSNPGCVQMRPQSAFLQDLNQDLYSLKEVGVSCIWTPYDLMILPATSSDLGLGDRITVPALTHPGMVKHPKSLAAIARAFSKPID
ncbi:MAG: alpha/beta fold hydrolase [Cyanobacteria bacterium P01_H01_bin.119]